MALYDKIAGTTETTFQIGSAAAGNVVATNTDGIAIQDESAVAKNLTVARPQGANQDVHAATYLDVKERILLIEFSFAGGTPPAGGANTGKYGFCHTSGGVYNAGQVYLDNGVSLVAVTVNKMQMLASTSAVTGTVSLIANGVYIAQTASAPYTWTTKGDGSGTNTGVRKAISIPITATAGNFDSTTSIPSGAKIMRVYCNVSTLYDGAATIAVRINGGTPLTVMATSENRPNKVGLYANTPFAAVGAPNAGVVRVILGGAPTVGAAEVVVEYNETFLG